MKIISNCPLCEAHGLHVMGEEESKVMQCLNCGYTSSERYIGTKDDNENFKKLHKDLQAWCKEYNGRIWLPVQITLQAGMLYPSKVDDDMKWTFAEMVDISEEDRENYPDGEGGFYEKRYNMDTPKFYDTFLEGMAELNQLMKDMVDTLNTDVD